MSASEIFGGENAESFYDEGLTASMKGDVATAAKHFESAIRLDQSMVSAYHQVAKCYARLGDVKKGIGVLSEVVKNRPELTAARIDLAGMLVQFDQYDAAKKHFQVVLNADPHNAKALVGFAGAEFAQGMWVEALAHAQQAQDEGGANFSTLYMLGRVAKLTGNSELSKTSLDKADAIIQKYQEMNEEKPEGNYLLGEITFFQGDFLAALEYFRKAEDRVLRDRLYLAYGESFGMVDVLGKQGLCYQRLGNADRAREMGERIKKTNPDHPSCRALLSMTSGDDSA
jgi:tetratricopeptide (TPR) repeat protein